MSFVSPRSHCSMEIEGRGGILFSDRRANCRTRAAHFLASKNLETENFQIFPFVNLICFAGINPFLE